MEQALVADGESVPAGSADFEQRPMAPRAERRRPTPTAQPTPPTRDRPAGSRPYRPTRRPGDERPRRQAGRGRAAIRRAPGRAVRGPRPRPTRPRSAGSARSCRASSPSSRRSGASRRPGPSWPARASCATRADADDEMRAMARDEIDRLEADETRLLEELKVLLLPRDPNDGRDVIMEIRGGAGGEEAALFAAELYRMYVRYAERHRFTPELLSLNETGHRRDQGGDRPDPRRRRVQPAQVRGRRPPRPAHPGDRVVGADPHLDGDRRRPARGRRGRDRDRRGARPADRRQARVGAGRPVGQHDRLGGARHAPADRASSSRSRTRRASTRTRPRRSPSCARGCTTSSSRSSARRIRWRGARWSGRATGRTRSGPTTSRRTGSPTTGSARPSTTCPTSWTATSTTSSTR